MTTSCPEPWRTLIAHSCLFLAQIAGSINGLLMVPRAVLGDPDVHLTPPGEPLPDSPKLPFPVRLWWQQKQILVSQSSASGPGHIQATPVAMSKVTPTACPHACPMTSTLASLESLIPWRSRVTHSRADPWRADEAPVLPAWSSPAPCTLFPLWPAHTPTPTTLTATILWPHPAALTVPHQDTTTWDLCTSSAPGQATACPTNTQV